MLNTTTSLNPKIHKGQLYFASLDPTLGSEQGGTRPVLILQNDTGNRHSPTTIIAPVTSKQKPSLPTHIVLDNQTGIEPGSIVLLEQIRTIDISRLSRFIGELNSNLLRQVEQCLISSLGISSNRNERPLVMTLCKECADTYRETKEYTLRRIGRGEQIKEPCTLCMRPGFDFELRKRAR